MRTVHIPYHIYVPVYSDAPSGVAYAAGCPVNSSWQDGTYGPNTAIIDRHIVHGLDQLVTGPISGWDCLDTVELAIRAYVLHETVYWMLPGVVEIQDSQVVIAGDPGRKEDGGSVIFPKYEYPDSLIEFFNKNRTHGYSVYSGWIHKNEQGNLIEGSDFWVQNYDRLRSGDDDIVRQVFSESFDIEYYKASYFSSAKAIGAGAYFGLDADREYEQAIVTVNASNHPEKIFKKLYESWNEEIVGGGIGLDIRLGPFLAIVLNRASNRDDIPNVIGELRDEFQPMRNELWDLFESPLREKRMKVAVRDSRKLGKAISNILPAGIPRKERPFRLMWNTTHVLWSLYQDWGASTAIKFIGDLLQDKNFSLTQVSTVDVAKKITNEIRAIDESLVQQLRNHLTESEQRTLGIIM